MSVSSDDWDWRWRNRAGMTMGEKVVYTDFSMVDFLPVSSQQSLPQPAGPEQPQVTLPPAFLFSRQEFPQPFFLVFLLRSPG